MLTKPQLMIHNLSFARNYRYFFKHLHVQLNAGEILQIQGENGSGKSTLLRILAGLIEPEEGSVCWENQCIFKESEPYKKVMRYLADRNGLKAYLTIEENLRLGAALLCSGPLSANNDIHSKWVPAFAGMAQHLSLGQQRRIAFARILLNPGKIWLLDEPMIGLDKKTQEWQLMLFENHLHAGGIIIIATHQPLLLKNKIKTIQLGEHSFA